MEVSVNFSPSLEDYDKVNTHKLQEHNKQNSDRLTYLSAKGFAVLRLLINYLSHVTQIEKWEI